MYLLIDDRCVSKVDILGHEHWHSRKEHNVSVQTQCDMKYHLLVV